MKRLTAKEKAWGYLYKKKGVCFWNVDNKELANIIDNALEVAIKSTQSNKSVKKDG